MFVRVKVIISLVLICVASSSAAQISDPLPSWNDGPVKKNIIAFVKSVTNPKDPGFVPVPDRIAAFDNDGTLWVEQPMYPQTVYSLKKIKQMAPSHPEWQMEETMKFALSNQLEKLDSRIIEKMLLVALTGMGVEDYIQQVKTWLAQAQHPRFKRLYTQLVYQPMLEMIRYLKKNQFTVYIVSGGGQDFIRSFANEVYGIPVNQVIGSTVKTNYQFNAGKPDLIKQPEILYMSEKQGKPEAIHLFIGKKPIITFGNSDGDRQMLEWTQSGSGKRLMLLVHHDDAVREYVYGVDSRVGHFSNSLMEEANNSHWNVISMKKDWRVIFPKK